MDTFSHWIQRIRRIGKPWKEEHVMWPGVSFRIIVLPQQGSKTSKEEETKKKIKLWRNKKEKFIKGNVCEMEPRGMLIRNNNNYYEMDNKYCRLLNILFKRKLCK